MVKPKKQYRTVSYYWNIKFTPHSKLPRSFQWLECQSGGMTRPSVSTSSSSIHSNSWNWNAHSSSFCRRAATRCSQAWKLNRFSRLLTWWFRGNIRWSCPLLFVHLFMQIQFFNWRKTQSTFRTQSSIPYVLSSRTAVVVGYALWKILQNGNTKLSLRR